MRERVAAAAAHATGDGLVLGSFDADGRLRTQFGSIPGVPCIDGGTGLTRHRSKLALVLLDGFVLVRKQFGHDFGAFVREWHHLQLLDGQASVPALFSVDEQRAVLIKNFLPFDTLRKRLADKGARILLAQTRDDPDLSHLSDADRIDAVLERGRALLAEVVDERFFVALEDQIGRIHRLGVVNLSLTFGNVLLEPQNDAPFLIDFEGSHWHSPISPLGRLRSNRDWRKYAWIYRREIEVRRDIGDAYLAARQLARAALERLGLGVRR